MKYIWNRMEKGMTALLLTVLFLAASALPSTASEEPKVLRVAFPQTKGYSMTAEDGEHYGLIVDALDEIAKYTGWKYEYIDVNSENLLERFETGEFDLMGGQYYMEGLEEFFGYPEYNCGYSKLILLARKDDDGIKSYDLSSFNGKTIGVFERASENIRRLQIYLDLNDLDCTLKYYNYDQLMETGNLNQFLESGEVDLLLGNSADSGESFYIAASFDSQPHYIVTVPGSQEILDGLNMALEKIYEADPNFAKKLYEANFPEAANLNAAVSKEEKEYIRQRETVIVAVPREWHPLFCLNSDASHNGFIPDILEKISDYSGLQFSYLYCDSYHEALEKLQSGEADVQGFYLGSDEDAIEEDLALTASYVELDSILVRNKESSYPAEGLTGAILKGQKMPQNIMADKVIEYANMTDALADVNRGKVDFFYGVSARLESIIQANNFTNLMQVNLVNDIQNISFALKSPAQPELLSILNKSINTLSSEEKAAIGSRNMISIGESHMTLLNIVYANPALAVGVVATVLILLLIVVIIISRSRLHAAAMHAELAKAEADNWAKSEFLSRMSHEIRTPMNAIVGLTDLMGMTEGLPEKAKENLVKIKSSSRYLLRLINDILDMSRIESGKMTVAREPFSFHAILDEIEDMMKQEAVGKGLRFYLEKKIQDDVLEGDAIRLRQVMLNLLSNAFKFTPSGGIILLRITEDASSDKDASFTIRVIDTGIGIAAEDQQRIFKSFEQLGSNYSMSQGTGLGLAISKSIVQLMGSELFLRSEPGKGSEFYFTFTLRKGRLDEKQTAGLETGMEKLEGIKILMAEDNDLNAEIAEELLRAGGAEVKRAENGKAALEMFEKSCSGEYLAILMDIQMPEMNGLEAAAAIRRLPRPDAETVPIIAMTANAFKEDEDSAIAAGMTGFVSKPIDVNVLYHELHQALKKGTDERGTD
ncbi:transporter substrate-binding domain-containing protein [Lacrimispora sp. NSJ-141]|uniref:Circadian input-output histidine kinase CikA n=1 Tax=Lientehia hominis TaxID=2897778 RepID=A0AAP2RJK5_9FIRM|nr:transporter substrate-binding domain-containing protein [Lientehia hominis]MCD2493397.1 transporter substrate-binding domain-containing protein [Lientehia hominis]